MKQKVRLNFSKSVIKGNFGLKLENVTPRSEQREILTLLQTMLPAFIVRHVLSNPALFSDQGVALTFAVGGGSGIL